MHLAWETAMDPFSTSRNIFRSMFSVSNLELLERNVGRLSFTLIDPDKGITIFRSLTSSTPYPVVDEFTFQLKQKSCVFYFIIVIVMSEKFYL